ncbi:MAG TPA: hypothetical protein PK167_03665 [Prolixibacteraceae bacterium]|nr:hypothetical protein [Prolixibacteraceae bacterium]
MGNIARSGKPVPGRWETPTTLYPKIVVSLKTERSSQGSGKSSGRKNGKKSRERDQKAHLDYSGYCSGAFGYFVAGYCFLFLNPDRTAHPA